MSKFQKLGPFPGSTNRGPSCPKALEGLKDAILKKIAHSVAPSSITIFLVGTDFSVFLNNTKKKILPIVQISKTGYHKKAFTVYFNINLCPTP